MTPNRVHGPEGGPHAIIVGGSICGLSCAHALIRAGCHVTVLEKATGQVTSAGAGLGLDKVACDAVAEWGLGKELQESSWPLTAEENRANDSATHSAHSIYRHEGYHHRAAHWNDLHSILFKALPEGFVLFDHQVTGFENRGPGRGVKVHVQLGRHSEHPQTAEFEGDFLVAADGSGSLAREKLVPGEKRRYSGYCAWRGVLEQKEQPELAKRIRTVYPDLGNTLYFDLAPGTHAVLYELLGPRLNWLWYVNQPEPELKGNSVTIKADEGKLAQMKAEAEVTWVPELKELMAATPAPFINAIYDKEPLSQFVWGKVILVGEAAHPTTPHGLRSTNMSIADAQVLGKCLSSIILTNTAGAKTWQAESLAKALAEFEKIRVPVARQEVLFSRHLGQLKQGILFEPQGAFPWLNAAQEQREALGQVNMQSFKV